MRMKITLNGQECKTVGELKVGEWGYVIADRQQPEYCALPERKLYPVMVLSMGDCYRVTKPADDRMCLEFVPAVQDDEHLIACTASHILERQVAELQADGWCIYKITVTPDGVGGFSYLAILRREASDE